MARGNGAPEFLRRAEAIDAGKQGFVMDEPEDRHWPETKQEPLLGPDDYGGRRQAQIEHELIAGMDKLTSEIRHDPLREIAVKTKALTYGEMMDYAQGIMSNEYKAPQTSDEFAAMLYGWAKRTLTG